MPGGAVIMIVRSHSARDGASRLTLPVPDGNCRASSWPGGGNGVANAGPVRSQLSVGTAAGGCSSVAEVMDDLAE
jgi:hypothetical protein